MPVTTLARRLALAWCALAFAPRLAAAHAGEPHAALSSTSELVWDAATAIVLLSAAVTYLLGLRRLRGDHTVTRGHAACYLAGLGFVALALLSPIDTYSEIWFSAHMGQHELLVLFAAPLVVVGRPELVLRAGLPGRTRDALRTQLHRPLVTRALRLLTDRWFAVLVHGAVVWIWHVPALFEAALQSETIHAFQHVTFFVTAVLFWWAMVRGRYGKLGYGLATLFVFFTTLHKGLLAVLFTVARHHLYPTHAERTAEAGGDPLVDQSLAGIIMWVPAGVITAALGVALFVAWLGAIEARSARR
jgi:putative membrane protein